MYQIARYAVYRTSTLYSFFDKQIHCTRVTGTLCTQQVPSPAKYMIPPKGVYLPISKLHSILAVANLLGHNNKSQICYCGQISLQSAAVNCSSSATMGVTFILLAMLRSVGSRYMVYPAGT